MKYMASSQTRSPQHYSITAQRCGCTHYYLLQREKLSGFLVFLYTRGHQHGAHGRLVTRSEHMSCPQGTLNLQSCLFIHVLDKCKTVLPTHTLYSKGLFYIWRPIYLFLILLFFVTVRRDQLTSGQSALTLPSMWGGQSCH